VANHEWDDRALSFSKREELLGKLPQRLAVECDKIDHREAVQNREKQLRVLRRLTTQFPSS
jgi:hypothetical protein